MSSLVPLDLPHSSSQELSSTSQCLPSLRSLWVECSSELLQLSHDAAIILDALYATNSKGLEPTATTSQALNMTTSTSQVSKHSLKSLLIQIGLNCQATNILKDIILQVCNTLSLCPLLYVCVFPIKHLNSLVYKSIIIHLNLYNYLI